MSRTRSPRRWTHSLVAGATACGLLGAPGVAVGDTPAQARFVRLQPADGSVVRSAEVPLAAGEQRLRTTTYSMVAATWDGPAPEVSVRTSDGGPWRELPPLADGPDAGSSERSDVQGATGLLWTGSRTGIDVRVEGGRGGDVELVLIDPGERPADTRVAASPLRRAADGEKPDRAPRPTWRTRKDWGADPSWRNGKPYYLNRMKQVHLHHTATGNDYRRRDVPGLIRGMYRYHTKSLGWFDIGYNFLVDRFGRIWVGRSGGPRRLVRGAHTLGFNHASVGVAVIGNFESGEPRRDVIRSLKRLAAWKYDKYDRDARRKVWVRSTGSDKYRDGRVVHLPAFDGHRDTNDTACPGQHLYDRLPTLRRRTQRRIDHFS